MGLNLQAKLGLDHSGFDAGIRGAMSVVSGLKGLIAGAFSVGAIAALTHKTIEYASHLNDLSVRLGVSTDFLQEFRYVAKQAGGDLESLTKVFEKLNSTRDAALGGDSKSMAAFQAFGIDQKALQGKRIEDLISGPIVKAFEKGDIQGKLGAAWRDIGGKGAGALTATFAEGFNKGREKAHEAGQVWSEDIILQLDDIGDRFTVLADVLVMRMGPAILKMIDVIRRLGEAADEALNFIVGKFNDFARSTSGRDKEDEHRRELNEAAIRRREAAGTISPAKAAQERRIQANSAAGDTGAQMAGQARDEYYDQRKAEEAARQALIDARKKKKNPVVEALQGKPDRSSDALVKVGNFLGSDAATSVIERIGNQTNQLLTDLNTKMAAMLARLPTPGSDSLFPPNS